MKRDKSGAHLCIPSNRCRCFLDMMAVPPQQACGVVVQVVVTQVHSRTREEGKKLDKCSHARKAGLL